jgi:hypothetical protein
MNRQVRPGQIVGQHHTAANRGLAQPAPHKWRPHHLATGRASTTCSPRDCTSSASAARTAPARCPAAPGTCPHYQERHTQHESLSGTIAVEQVRAQGLMAAVPRKRSRVRSPISSSRSLG